MIGISSANALNSSALSAVEPVSSGYPLGCRTTGGASTSDGSMMPSAAALTPSENQELGTLVPDDAMPGVSLLDIVIDGTGGAEKMEVPIPKEAMPGDRLLLYYRNGGQAELCCRIRRDTACQAAAQQRSAASPTCSTMRIQVIVPHDAVPGETHLSIDVSEGRTLRFVVPLEAKAGDRLTLSRDSSGAWKILPLGPRNEYTPTDDAASADQTEREGKSVYCEVPKGVMPGVTVLEVEGKRTGQVLRVTVPPQARVGDRLEMREIQEHAGQQTTWTVRVLGPVADEQWKDISSSCVAAGLRKPQAPEMLFEKLVAIARRAGAYVNQKITRGSAPPLHVMGIIATDRIEQGEVLIRIPGHLALAPETFRKTMPGIYNAVQDAGSVISGRRTESAQATCLSWLLQRAVADAAPEAAATVDGDTRAAPQVTTPDRGDSPDLDEVPELWKVYAEVLLAEDFRRHPHMLAGAEFISLRQLFEPSPEPAQFATMLRDVFAVHAAVNQGLPSLCPELSVFLQARLSLLTRTFHCPEIGTANVPITDFLNHSKDPGILYEWDATSFSHVVTAKRIHESGEELLTSYGPRSNTLLFRTYGFTLPPQDEPSWGYVVQCDRPQELLDRYLPPARALMAIQLETWAMEESLATALNACMTSGGNAREFLRELCSHCLEPYLLDPSLNAALESLRQAREADPTSGAWWQHPPPGGFLSQFPQTDCFSIADRAAHAEHALRVKMSEYLCLTVHIEALDFIEGRLPANQCLGSGHLRECLQSCLKMLDDGFSFTLTLDGPEVEP